MKITTHRLHSSPQCPTCDATLDAYTSMYADRASIKPGDLTVCAYCAAALQWDGTTFSRLTGSALILARLDDRFLAAERFAREYMWRTYDKRKGK